MGRGEEEGAEMRVRYGIDAAEIVDWLEIDNRFRLGACDPVPPTDPRHPRVPGNLVPGLQPLDGLETQRDDSKCGSLAHLLQRTSRMFDLRRTC